MAELKFKHLVRSVACTSLLHTMYIVSARLFLTDSCTSNGTIISII